MLRQNQWPLHHHMLDRNPAFWCFHKSTVMPPSDGMTVVLRTHSHAITRWHDLCIENLILSHQLSSWPLFKAYSEKAINDSCHAASDPTQLETDREPGQACSTPGPRPCCARIHDCPFDSSATGSPTVLEATGLCRPNNDSQLMVRHAGLLRTRYCASWGEAREAGLVQRCRWAAALPRAQCRQCPVSMARLRCRCWEAQTHSAQSMGGPHVHPVCTMPLSNVSAILPYIMLLCHSNLQGIPCTSRAQQSYLQESQGVHLGGFTWSSWLSYWQ